MMENLEEGTWVCGRKRGTKKKESTDKQQKKEMKKGFNDSESVPYNRPTD